ncbi:hypothetical protein [Cytobacillus sp. IB215665]|uniref:hypothetical protein n=1 Tax=Cytobacillus sp. IB215665 TaxID=3097357 RepID=UPI002A15FB92|nr:hypothetical protein [Cytobacillus sp. IB215665]MDX8367150.1 hypothetical protein [Cytobacillus sp. IB215665]
MNKYKGLILSTEILPTRFTLLNDCSKSDRKEALKFLYYNKINDDAITSGVLRIQNDGLAVLAGQSMPAIAGFLYEAFVVRHANENKEIKKELYMWSNDGKRRLSDKQISKIEVLGLGFPEIKETHPDIYAPQHYNNDIGFIKYRNYVEGAILFNKNQLSNDIHLLYNNIGRSLGIQIKAITGNERKEIIEPIIKNQYSHVLTLLRNNKSKKQSVDECRSILNKMYNNNEIDIDTMVSTMNAIRSPEQVGIRQNEVDDYYETIQYWYEDGMTNGNIISNPLGQQAANAILV